jgi:hypothetical protein
MRRIGEGEISESKSYIESRQNYLL